MVTGIHYLQIFIMPSNKKDNKELIIITGPTACGKTTLAVKLAIKINGEILLLF